MKYGILHCPTGYYLMYKLNFSNSAIFARRYKESTFEKYLKFYRTNFTNSTLSDDMVYTTKYLRNPITFDSEKLAIIYLNNVATIKIGNDLYKYRNIKDQLEIILIND